MQVLSDCLIKMLMSKRKCRRQESQRECCIRNLLVTLLWSQADCSRCLCCMLMTPTCLQTCAIYSTIVVILYWIDPVLAPIPLACRCPCYLKSCFLLIHFSIFTPLPHIFKSITHILHTNKEID